MSWATSQLVNVDSNKEKDTAVEPFLLVIPYFQWLPLLRTRALQSSAAMKVF